MVSSRFCNHVAEPSSFLNSLDKSVWKWDIKRSESGLVIFTPGKKKGRGCGPQWEAELPVLWGRGKVVMGQTEAHLESQAEKKKYNKGLWYYWLLLFAGHDAEWHEENASALILYVFSRVWSWQGISQLSLHKIMSFLCFCHVKTSLSSIRSGPVLSSEQTVCSDTQKSQTEGFFKKGLGGGYPVLHFFFSTAPLAPSSHFHTLSSSL